MNSCNYAGAVSAAGAGAAAAGEGGRGRSDGSSRGARALDVACVIEGTDSCCCEFRDRA